MDLAGANVLLLKLITRIIFLLFTVVVAFAVHRLLRKSPEYKKRFYLSVALRTWWNDRDERRFVHQPPIETSSDPTKSGHFQQLPAEIRLQIYDYVLGSRVIHLLGDEGRLYRRRCLSENVNAWYHPCWKLRASPLGLGSFLRANRHLYTEAVEILYGQNTFHFLRPSCFIRFVRSTPPLSVAKLKSFKLYVNPTLTGENTAYAAIWPILRSIPSLKEVRILIAPTVMTRDVWKQHETPLLEPIKNFTRELTTFEVYVAVFPDWISEDYLNACHMRPIKEMEQLSGAHLSRYSLRIN